MTIVYLSPGESHIQHGLQGRQDIRDTSKLYYWLFLAWVNYSQASGECTVRSSPIVGTIKRRKVVCYKKCFYWSRSYAACDCTLYNKMMCKTPYKTQYIKYQNDQEHTCHKTGCVYMCCSWGHLKDVFLWFFCFQDWKFVAKWIGQNTY